jgi:hypothetical protein
MRTMGLVLSVFFSMSGLASAQDWEQFVSIPDGFKIDFPGQPKRSDITWKSEYGYDLPAHVYSVDKGKERYSMTVVDYTGVRRMGIERSAKCPPGAETCIGTPNGGLNEVIGPGYAVQDIRGAITYTTFQFIKRDAKITQLLWNWEDLVEGHEIHLTNNADQSRTMAFIAMRENKLYIMEGTVPKGYPEPGLFFQSIGWVDEKGNGVRYSSLYINQVHGLRQYQPPSYGIGGVAGPGQAGQPGSGAPVSQPVTAR